MAWPTAVYVVVVVFELNRYFYPAALSAVHPVSVPIFHPGEIQIMWPQTAVRQTKKTKIAK